MPNQPVHFDFHPELPPVKVEAASRRRLRFLEQAYPAVSEWQVCLSPIAATTAVRADIGFEARAFAGIASGARLEARGSSTDPLGALRVAFNALEARLEEDSGRARSRAAEWLFKLRIRVAQREVA